MQDYGRQAGSDSAVNALLGPGLVVEGKLSFEGQVRLDGTFTGEINTTGSLIVGETAKVTAEISCGSIVIHGEVNGNIHATESVELAKPARVKGDITTPSLSIDKGVFFDGNSVMGNGGVVSMNRRDQRKMRGRAMEPSQT